MRAFLLLFIIMLLTPTMADQVLMTNYDFYNSTFFNLTTGDYAIASQACPTIVSPNFPNCGSYLSPPTQNSVYFNMSGDLRCQFSPGGLSMSEALVFFFQADTNVTGVDFLSYPFKYGSAVCGAWGRTEPYGVEKYVFNGSAFAFNSTSLIYHVASCENPTGAFSRCHYNFSGDFFSFKAGEIMSVPGRTDIGGWGTGGIFVMGGTSVLYSVPNSQTANLTVGNLSMPEYGCRGLRYPSTCYWGTYPNNSTGACASVAFSNSTDFLVGYFVTGAVPDNLNYHGAPYYGMPVFRLYGVETGPKIWSHTPGSDSYGNCQPQLTAWSEFEPELDECVVYINGSMNAGSQIERYGYEFSYFICKTGGGFLSIVVSFSVAAIIIGMAWLVFSIMKKRIGT